MPEVTRPADPADNAPSRSWIPGRKAIAGGIAGVVTFFIMAAARHFLGLDLPASVETLIVAGVAWVINYLVPPAAKDVVDHLNNAIVKLAVEDPTSPVTPAATK